MKTPARASVWLGVFLAGLAFPVSDAAAQNRSLRRSPRVPRPPNAEKARSPAEKPPGTLPPVIDGVPVQSIDETLYVPPKAAKLEPPVYPYEMLKQRVSGEASISCMVDTDGKVVQVNVLNATRPEFAEALTAAIEAAEFAYATREGSPIASVLGFRFRFDPKADDEKREDLELLDRVVKRPQAFGHARRLDRPLKPRLQPSPAFPVRMLRKGLRGSALIEFLLDEYGEARLPRVLSATDPAFGYAAAHAVARWRFEPPTVDGNPVVMRVTVPFQFTVE